MKYLVLRSFTSYGRYLKKGTIVDESDIRNVRLRRSEKKIYPVVSSSNIASSVVDTDKSTAEQHTTNTVAKKEESKIKINLIINKNLTLG